MPRPRVLRVSKGERTDIEIGRKRRLHELRINVREQPVTKGKNAPEIALAAVAETLLVAGEDGRVIAHEGRKHGEGKPAQKELARTVAAEAARIRTAE